MTLDEIHNQLENIQRELTRNRFMYTDTEIKFNGELIKAIEEFEVYKKAFQLACEIINHGDDFKEYDTISIMNNLLKKAGEENV